MTKAKREIADAMSSTDVVVEVLDARLPHSSENPMIMELRKGKACLKVLNKSDLADPKITAQWIRHMKQESGTMAIALSAKQPEGKQLIPRLCRQLAPHRGTVLKPLRIMITGIPNAGKSTLINLLVGKRAAKVADEAAVTKMQQQYEIEKGVLINDTPGITWPKFETEEGGYRLAATGAIGKNAMDPIEVAGFAAEHLLTHYPELLKMRYGVESLPQHAMDLLEEIGRRRGCLQSGGLVDIEKAANLFLLDFRSGKIGRISLEKPEE
jgi:ribosome biogenesis GTPase A